MRMYPYMVMNDGTGVLHSEVYEEGESQRVEVHFQRETEDGYHVAYCILPEYEWIKCEGFTRKERSEFEVFLRDNVFWIYEYARGKK